MLKKVVIITLCLFSPFLLSAQGQKAKILHYTEVVNTINEVGNDNYICDWFSHEEHELLDFAPSSNSSDQPNYGVYTFKVITPACPHLTIYQNIKKSIYSSIYAAAKIAFKNIDNQLNPREKKLARLFNHKYMKHIPFQNWELIKLDFVEDPRYTDFTLETIVKVTVDRESYLLIIDSLKDSITTEKIKINLYFVLLLISIIIGYYIYPKHNKMVKRS